MADHKKETRSFPVLNKKILALESSCDDASVCVATMKEHGRVQVESLVTSSQIEIHKPFGGVVPEVASRNHYDVLYPTLEEAMKKASCSWNDLSAVSVTNRPGLVGSLLVGVTMAKSIAYAHSLPLIPVHHLEGHAMSPFLGLENQEYKSIAYPMIVAIVSGGHSSLYFCERAPHLWEEGELLSQKLGSSRDDAAGEAFDKIAKKLGFPYPGGVWIDQTSQGGDVNRFQFSKALPQKSVLDYSFSGLKTAVSQKIEELKNQGKLEEEIVHLCASVQKTIVDSLLDKIFLAVKKKRARSIAIVGGVAANSALRLELKKRSGTLQVLVPKKEYCTDNAAMIAAVGGVRFTQQKSLSVPGFLDLSASAVADV